MTPGNFSYNNTHTTIFIDSMVTNPADTGEIMISSFLVDGCDTAYVDSIIKFTLINWDCVNNGCVEIIDNTGAYTSLLDCQLNCANTLTLFEEIGSFSIYPNPSSGLVNIAGDFTEEVVINVFDNIGQKVLSEKSALDIRLDLSSFGKGMYFIQIDGSNVYPVVID